MPTSRPLVAGDRFIALCLPFTIGDSYVFEQRLQLPEHLVLCSDFALPSRAVNNWWTVVGVRVFGIANCFTSNDSRLLSAIRRGTAPALYVREGDTVEPWDSYQAVLLDRRMRALTERHQGLIAQLRLHGAGNIQLRIEDDVVVLQCSGALPDPAILGPTPEGVRIETSPSVDYLELETAVIADILQHNRPLRGLNFSSNRYHTTDQQRQMAERLAAAMNIPLDTSASVVAAFDITPPPPAPPAPPPAPPAPPPPPTRFNLLECDLPAAALTPAKQKNFDALAELQAEFRAAKVAAKTTVQPVLTRFDLLECDEPAEPVVVKPKWSAPQSPQPAPQQRRTVEDILDLTTSGPLEALAALQIVKAEIVRDLRQRETN